MDMTLITLFAVAAALLLGLFGYQRFVKQRLDRDRRLAELDRQSAREGRLRKEADQT